MKEFKILKPISKSDLDDYYYLRWKILRKPLHQSLDSIKDEFEGKSEHICIKNNDEMLAAGRLHIISNENNYKIAQIRYMAVENKYQGIGLGTEILIALEDKAKYQGVNKIILEARESAINFYKKNNYKVIKKTHLLLKKIQHWRMEKEL